MKRVILGTYIYQLLYQLPQLLILPILAKLLPSAELVAAAKYLILINLISLIADWGYSTLGAQKIFQHREDQKKMHEIFQAGERFRVILWLVLCVTAFVVFFMLGGYSIGDILLPSVIVILGTLTSLLLPNWLIVGTRMYEKVILNVLFIRVFSISILVYFAKITEQTESALMGYFVFLLLATMFLRRHIKKQVIFVSSKNLQIDFKSAFKSGFALMLGSLFCYGYLSTGVFVVDQFGASANAASFVIAERVFVIARAAYAPLVQYLFVGMNESNVNNKILIKLFFALFIVPVFVWLTGNLLITYIFNDRIAIQYFNILIVGFSFLGFTHHFVTLKVLGGGSILIYLKILFLAFIVYVTSLWLYLIMLKLEAGLATSFSIVSAEISLFVLGAFFIWMKNRPIKNKYQT